eukprot:m.194649 g.194649  ORF g.194649 m.194649 type:complete len:123 (+) comp15676_c0_seq10:1603-1971(+)
MLCLSLFYKMEKELRDTSMVVKRKEKEWKSRYPNEPWLPRSDLLRKGRQTILENVSSNSLSHSEEIESQLKKLLWDRLGSYIVDVLYTRAADSGDAEDFQALYFRICFFFLNIFIFTLILLD